MGTLIWKPATDAFMPPQVIVVASSRTYTFTPGIPEMVVPEDVAQVTTALKALQGTVTAPAVPALSGGGTGDTTTYGYKLVLVTAGGDTIPSSQVATTPLGTATAPTGVASAGTTNLTTATYTCAVSYVNAFGESIGSANSSNVSVTATNIVTWTAGSVPAGVTSVKFYLTAGGAGATLGLIGTVTPVAGSAVLVENLLAQAPGVLAPPAVDTTGANATLSVTNYNIITWPLASHASGYKVLRSAGGATQGLIATLGSTATTFNDIGVVATSYTPSIAAPPADSVVAGPADA